MNSFDFDILPRHAVSPLSSFNAMGSLGRLALCGLFVFAVSMTSGCGGDEEDVGFKAAVDGAGGGEDGQLMGDASSAQDVASALDAQDGPSADALDGAGGPQDAGLEDAGAKDVGVQDAGLKDAGPKPKCGDGKCDAPKETLISCVQDCSGGANCGDGKCDGVQENAFTCKPDCEVTTSKLVPCIMGGCTTDVLACLKVPECAQTLGCLQSCGNDMGCLAGCGSKSSPETQETLGAVVMCGAQKGCFGVGGSGATCGDGKCEGPGENAITCKKDCPAPVCGDGKCDPPLESFVVCKKDCPKPVCGNGKCEPPLETALLCAKDCVPKTCGDGKCDKDAGETSKNCYKDCKPDGTQAKCIAGKCAKENLSCSVDLKCLKSVTCTGKCEDKACFDACGAGLPAGSAKLFKAIEDCGIKNGCL